MNATPRFLTESSTYVDLQPYEDGRIALNMKATPQGETFATVLGGYEDKTDDGYPLFANEEVVIQGPRRCSKTSTIQAVLVGRLLSRPNYRVVSTAQSGIKARARFKELMGIMEAKGLADCYWSAGTEQMTFFNGSLWILVPPKPSAFRSEAADCVWIDELQELPAELGSDLDAAISPTMDTRPAPQIILSGTPGPERAGLLWDALTRGRAGDIGIVDYAANEDDDTDDEGVWLNTHPGIGTLTTLERMRRQRTKLGKEKFAREYMGRWPASSQLRLISSETWSKGSRKTKPRRPARFAVGYEVAHDASCAAVVAVWRAAGGSAWVEVLAAREGTRWLPRFLLDLSRKYRAGVVGVAYDSIGQNLAIAETLDRARPRPKLAPLLTRKMIAASGHMLSEIQAGAVLHSEQPDMDKAVEVAVKRKMNEGGWVLSRVDPHASPLIAATAALSAYDAAPERQAPSITVAT